jgi:hypothetical protein
MSRPLNLLLVEDSADDAALLPRHPRGANREWVCERRQAQEQLKQKGETK